MKQSAIDASANALENIWSAIEDGQRTILVDSPPGAGKSTLVREMARRYTRFSQVPIIVQTNEQADDMVRGFLCDDIENKSGYNIGRLHSINYVPPNDIIVDQDSTVSFSRTIQKLQDCHFIVAPAAKWATIDYQNNHWPFAVIDEAYQMRSDQLLPVGVMMDRLLLVGDPGQLAPFTIADDTRFRGRPLSPLETAALTILTTNPDTVRIPLPASWRLPHHAASVISDAFYQTPFISGTSEGERYLEVSVRPINLSPAVQTMARTGWGFLELDDLIVPPNDQEAVNALGQLVRDILNTHIIIHDEYGSRPLLSSDIAIGVTHRDQRDHVRAEVHRVLADIGLPIESITIDTANVLQGREFEIVLVWHPLSGRRDASTFHLDAGRLCVLMSRHRQGCIIVSRGGLRNLLKSYPVTEPVWFGESPPMTDGWHAHLSILEHLDNYRA